MKRNLLIITALLLGSFISQAQSWIDQNTNFPNQFTGVNDINVPASGVAWITSYDGGGTSVTYNDFSRTTDGGLNWTAGTVGPISDTIFQFSNISAIDGNTAWVCRFNQVAQANGGVWKTIDGGLNWTRQDTTMFAGANSFADFVHFWDANTGVTVGDPDGGRFEIYTTTDGGTTWTPVPQANIPVELTGEFAIVDYYDVVGNTIWFATNKGRIYKSVDNGLNWTVATILSLPGTQAMKIAFLDANNGLASVTNTTSGALVSLRRTTDGGATWSIQSTTGKFFANDFGRVPGATMYMSTGVNFTTPGETGTSYSLDSGVTWITIDTIQHTAFGAYDINNVWTGGFTEIDPNFIMIKGIFKFEPGALVSVQEPVTVKADISSFPNPSRGIVTMNFKAGKNIDVKATVVNAIGEQVYSSKFTNVTVFTHTFDFSYLPKGVYMLNLDYGTERSTQKLIIQ